MVSRPSVTLPISLEDVPKKAAELRAYIAHLKTDLKTYQGLLNAVIDVCPHTGAKTWNTGDGDGSQGFQCAHCETIGTR